MPRLIAALPILTYLHNYIIGFPNTRSRSKPKTLQKQISDTSICHINNSGELNFLFSSPGERYSWPRISYAVMYNPLNASRPTLNLSKRSIL